MASQPDSIPPIWNSLQPFREVFLSSLETPEDQEAFRRVGDVIHSAVIETGGHLPPLEPSMVHVDLAAALADLIYLESFLRLVVLASAETFTLEPNILRLALRAEGWADGLASVASEIQEAIAS
ncbi:MAG: hypothetical protein K0U98_21540 [Deltaproteobacteria bacterium]|nr:hypothetical protein [Deltaproteobacteria bacterium]